MAKKKKEPTFRELVLTAESEIDYLRKRRTGDDIVPHLIFEGFTASFEISIQRSFYPKFGRDLSKVFAYHTAERKLKDMDSFWKNWPFKVTTFGMYLRSASSALRVASRFLESVYDIAVAARVEEFKTFNSDGFRTPELERWAELIFTRLDEALSFSLWPKGVMRRDYEVMVSRVNEEMAIVGQEKIGNCAIN